MKPITTDYIFKTEPLLSPEALKNQLPATQKIKDFIQSTRENIQKIIHYQSDKLLIILGPCSIHNVSACLKYAEKVKPIADKLEERCVILMRAYFEKPRTSSGWKGLIIDPDLEGTPNIPKGLETARIFLNELAQIGLPAATEFIDPLTPLYIGDLISWAAIGARTAESPTHRHLASGLPMPIGIKNNTAGCTKSALFGVEAARHPQSYLGINEKGQAAAITTYGNPHTHIILRGGQSGPNYTGAHVDQTVELLKTHRIQSRIMIDCSHGNSQKNPQLQPHIWSTTLQNIKKNANPIMGLMLESHLEGGAQIFPSPYPLNPNQSITDECLSWEETLTLLNDLH